MRSCWMDSLPIILVARPGRGRNAIQSSLPGTEVRVVDSVDVFPTSPSDSRGIVLLGPDLSADESLAILAREADQEMPRSVAVVRVEAEGLQLRPLSVGHPLSFRRLLEIAGDPEGKGLSLSSTGSSAWWPRPGTI